MAEINNTIPDDQLDDFLSDLPQNASGMELPPLTSQQDYLISFLRNGIPLTKAAGMVGMKPKVAKDFCDTDERGAEALVAQRAILGDTAPEINIEFLTLKALEVLGQTATATEAKQVLEFLAKMHKVGGFSPAAAKGAIESGPKVPKNVKQVKQKSDAELQEIAQLGYDLEPVPITRTVAEEVRESQGE